METQEENHREEDRRSFPAEENRLGVVRKPRSLSARSVSSPRARSVANQVSSSRPQSSPSALLQSNLHLQQESSSEERGKSEISLRTEFLKDSLHNVRVRSATEEEEESDSIVSGQIDAVEEDPSNDQSESAKQESFEEQLAKLHRDVVVDSGVETDLTANGAPEENETIDTINLSEYQDLDSPHGSQSLVTLRASSLPSTPRPHTSQSLGYFSQVTQNSGPQGGEGQEINSIHYTAPYEVLSLYNLEQPQSRMPETNKLAVVGVGVLVVLVAIPMAAIINSYHKINEGHVGIYFKYGALQDSLTYPGVHFMAPFVAEYSEILIRPVTDTVEPFEAVTKDGIQNTFRGIQIMTRIKVDKLIETVKKFGPEFKHALVFDRVKEELRKFSANHTIHEVYNTMFLQIVGEVQENVETSLERLGEDALEILNLVIPKPEIPKDIAHNYRQVKVQWTEQLVATQQQKTEKIKKQTESIRAIADAERNKAVLEIKIKEKILDKEGEQTISDINNAIVKAQQENIADIDKYKVEKEAEANTKLYTGEYVKLNMAKELAKNTKLYFSGDNSVLGGLLNKILKD